MKIKLIHNNNINFNLIESFEDSFFFGVTKQALLRKGFSFDEHIHNELIDCFDNEVEYDLIIIPSSLSIENYIEFTGLRVALHIRLTPEFRHTRVPILFISEETPIQIGKITALANLFFTKGIFHSSTQASEKLFNEINEIKESGLKILSESDYNNFLDKIKIDPPPNYDHRHSVANEYTIHSWSKAIGLKNEKIEKELGSRLYFKYLDCINKNAHIKDLDIIKLKVDNNQEAKVLLIDDEAEKGWKQFYKKLFGNYIKLIVPENDEIDYNAGSKKIKDDVIELIKTEKPDLVLLDLRLSEEDTGKVSGLTGIEIIKELEKRKDINKGIRIIITSASNKIWNYLDAGIRNNLLLEGVILKSNDSFDNIHPVISIVEIVNTSIPKAFFLKEVYCLLEKAKVLADCFEEEFKKLIINSSEVIFKLCHLGLNEKKYFNHAYIEIFKLIEGFFELSSVFQDSNNSVFIFSKTKKLLVAKSENGKDFSTKIEYANSNIKQRGSKGFNTDFKAVFVLYYGYGIMFNEPTRKKWSRINLARNEKAVHGSKIDIGVIESSEIREVLEFLIYLFNPENRSDKNVENVFLKKSSINFIRIENQSKVNKIEKTYSQEIVIIHTSSIIDENIYVNNQHFKLTKSPQIIELKNLPSDGKEVNVKAQIEGEEVKVEAKLFTAPKSEEKKLTDRDKIKEAKKKFRESLNPDETD